MNILIVDDEIPAVQGILQIIDWKRLKIKNTYTAYSMREAMEIFSNNAIELLLTDIEMSGGTGFDLIRWCNSRDANYVSIILSGFPNFHYAQRAITLGVFEYLLKPVENSALEAALVRGIGHLKKHGKTQHKREFSGAESLVEQVQFYIFEHISQEITRNDIANSVNLSPEYLSTYFKRETGVTLTDYIRNERIAFARRLLKQTNLPVSIISENVGYDSLSYFSSVFRQIVGCTPREYRKQCH
ncbi:MAG: AraC family transcriptional regulator [Clostridia bacterium]|nr:AraC family transcriptional regulator [Clostridia bacterium]